MILDAGGYTVESFPSAIDFLEQYDPLSFGCILTDVRMPEMDGLQLLARLQALKCTLPILVLTGHADIAMAVRAMKLGAHDFLEKPVDPNTLRDTVSTALKLDEANSDSKQALAEIETLLKKLTAREQEVMNLLVDGRSAKIVGEILGTAQSTIRIQRQSILKKMQADNVSDLIRMLGRAGRFND